MICSSSSGLLLKVNIIINALLTASVSVAALQANAQSQSQVGHANNTILFNIFCDPNGGGTGECKREDNHAAIGCEFASQNFIQCQGIQGAQFICVNFAPNQFECQGTQGRDPMDNQQNCSIPPASHGNCRSTLRSTLTTVKSNAQSSSLQTIKSTRLTSDTLVDTLGD